MIKSNIFTRTLISLTTVSAVLLGISACSSTPEPVETPTPVETVAPVADYGDVVGTGEIITDELGSYETIAINPEAEALKHNYDVLNVPMLYAVGFTEEDAYSAQDWVVPFVASEVVDSITVDNFGNWDKWVAEHADTYLAPTEKERLLSFTTDKPAVFILNNFNDALPGLVRDSTPREKNVIITVDKITTDNSFITVSGTTSVDYRLDDARTVTKFIGKGSTEEELKEYYPQLFDGVNDSVNNVPNNWSYSLMKTDDGSWRIVGYTADYGKNDIR
jgi:ABC-type Fe3+-hydroxamate transport system substrate-binding protein